MVVKRRKNSKANAISDRSGFKHPMNEMVEEPGTGFLVHKSESDGRWNLVDSPLNHPERYVKFGDPAPIEGARPEQDLSVDLYINDENGDPITGEDGQPVETE